MNARLDALRAVVLKRLPHGNSAPAKARVQRFLAEGVIERLAHAELAYDDGALWETTGDRSRDRFTHAFLWFVDWPESVRNDVSAARAAHAQSMAWLDRSPRWRDDEQSLAFHDETTAQRLLMHLGLVEAQRRHLAASEMGELERMLDDTAALLATDAFHAGLNNHGMFQDLALLQWAGQADWADEAARLAALDTSLRRLNAYFRHAFTSEGVHVEHAPSYHLMVARHLSAHLEALHAVGHDDLPEFERLLAGTVAYATHAVLPDGLYPPISDTTTMPLTRQAGLFNDPGFDHAVTMGQKGSPPGRTLVLPESGYAIHRSAWGDPDATFVYFSCAYNNGYHKHADENSLFLRHRGLDLVSEAGPYGYNYDDPLTRYGYSQYAHSTLVLDGTSIPRTGGPMDTVTMQDRGADGPGFSVTGRNARLVEAVHERTVTVTEPAGTVQVDVHDHITSSRSRTHELLWHVGAGLEVVLHGTGYELHHRGMKVMDALFTADVPLKVTKRRGIAGRAPEGWRFPTMGAQEPSDVVVVSFEGATVDVTTEIRLADFTYRDRHVTPWHGWRRWEGEVGLNHLRVKGLSQQRLVVAFTSLHQIGDFTYNYKPTLDEVGVEALYILDDFGNQGSYYLQDHGDRAIFRSVQALITSVMESLGLTPADLVFVGSSKGASAALMHGMTLGVGSIFVGGPQTRIGSFLSKPHPNVLEFMTGGTSPDHIAGLDAVLPAIATETVERWRDSSITIVVGDRDHHYKGHVLPFVDHVAGLGAEVTLVTLPGHTHGTFGPAYRDALAAHLSDTSTADANVLAATAAADGADVTATVTSGRWPQYAARLYRGTEIVDALPYGPLRPLTFGSLTPGRYRVRVFGRVSDGAPDAAVTTGWVTVASNALSQE